MRKRNEREFEIERDQLRKIHAEKLNQMNMEFERDKQVRKEKFASQISKYTMSGKGVDDLDDNDEKKEIAVKTQK